MSNVRINVRFFMWHFKVSNEWEFSWEYNNAHKGLPYGWFDVYEFKPFKRR